MKQGVSRHERTNTNPLRNYYRCACGKWLCAGFPQYWEAKWPMFCQALGQPELHSDPRFNTWDKRLDNCKELISIFDNIFITKPRDEWLKIFTQYDLISAPVNTHLDLETDPQVTENEYIVEFDDPLLGKIKLPGYPVQFSQTIAKTTSLGPSLGEHTREVLKNLGEYSDEEIAQFEQDGVI